MCRLRNIAMRDYQKSGTTGQTPDKVISMCRYASQATQNIRVGLQEIYIFLILFFITELMLDDI